MNTNTITLFIAGILIIITAMIIKKLHHNLHHKRYLYSEKTGKEVKLTPDVKDALISEYNKIKNKTSKFSKKKRDKIEKLMIQLIETGQINNPQ